MAEQCTTEVFTEHQEAHITHQKAHYSAWVLLDPAPELDHMSVSQPAGAWHDCVQVMQLYYAFRMLKRANSDMVAVISESRCSTKSMTLQSMCTLAGGTFIVKASVSLR